MGVGSCGLDCVEGEDGGIDEDVVVEEGEEEGGCLNESGSEEEDDEEEKDASEDVEDVDDTVGDDVGMGSGRLVGVLSMLTAGASTGAVAVGAILSVWRWWERREKGRKKERKRLRCQSPENRRCDFRGSVRRVQASQQVNAGAETVEDHDKQKDSVFVSLIEVLLSGIWKLGSRFPLIPKVVAGER